MSSAKCCSFRLGLNVLMSTGSQRANTSDLHISQSKHKIFFFQENAPKMPTNKGCIYQDFTNYNIVTGDGLVLKWKVTFNTLKPRQNGRRFADHTFKRIFLNENVRISNKVLLKFVPKGPINNNPTLVQIMAWRRSGDKPLSEPMMVSLLMHLCVTRPQWVKSDCDIWQLFFSAMPKFIVYPLRGTQLVTEIWRLTSWILLLGPS